MSAMLNKVSVGLLAFGCGTTLAIGGVTVAEASGSPSTVHACEAKATHDLHLGHCKRGERAITLSERGPKGVPGPRGTRGPAGPGAVVWQAEVGPSGTVLSAHVGITVTSPSTNHYVVAWSGFPGEALPYCTALGSDQLDATKVVESTTSGSIELTMSSGEPFWCQVVQE